MDFMKTHKKWIILLAVLALFIAAFFPARATVREYRFQKALAELSASRGTNTEHLSVCLESMCSHIDAALETEDAFEQRSALSALSTWAQDCSDSLGEIDHYFDAYIATKDRSYIGRYFTGDFEIRDGCLKLSGWLTSYITGQLDTSEDAFRETLLNVKEDLLWLNGLWEEAFPEECSEREFIAAFHELFYTHEPEFSRFFIELHQALESQNN